MVSGMAFFGAETFEAPMLGAGAEEAEELFPRREQQSGESHISTRTDLGAAAKSTVFLMEAIRNLGRVPSECSSAPQEEQVLARLLRVARRTGKLSGEDENDLSVERGQLVTVLNKVTKLQMSLHALLFSLMNVSAGWQSQSQWPPAI